LEVLVTFARPTVKWVPATCAFPVKESSNKHNSKPTMPIELLIVFFILLFLVMLWMR
jgi:hypothetical protein